LLCQYNRSLKETPIGEAKPFKLSVSGHIRWSKPHQNHQFVFQVAFTLPSLPLRNNGCVPPWRPGRSLDLSLHPWWTGPKRPSNWLTNGNCRSGGPKSDHQSKI